MAYKQWSKNKYERYLKEGRGQGDGKNYKPWIRVQDFSSKGRVSREYGYTIGREYHLFSDLELRYFILLDWASNVIDIKEQYPLKLETTLAIANQTNIRHPVDNKSEFPVVMSTDFLITIHKDGKNEIIARTIKPTSELEKIRTIEKFEIERIYWEKQGVDWGIVTEKDISLPVVQNIEWFRKSFFIETREDYSEEVIKEMLYILKQTLLSKDDRLMNITSKLDDDYRVEPGTFLSLFKYLLAHKEIRLDLEMPINTSESYYKRILITKEG